MKPIEEIKNEVAVKHGYDDWNQFIRKETYIPRANEIVDATMQEYAKQCCDEQIKTCGERFKLLYGLKEDVKTILNTPNVVTK